MTPNVIAILKEARHYLIAGKYADSVAHRQSAYICYAITQVEKYSALNFEAQEYAAAQLAVQGAIYPYSTLHSYLENKLHTDGYFSGLRFWTNDSEWIKARDNWLDEFIAKLEAK